MKGRRADRQAAALDFTAATVPAFRLCVGGGWLPALAGGCGAALLLTLLRPRLGRRSLAAAAERGLPGKAILLVLTAALGGLVLWTGALSGGAFPETAGSGLAAALLLLTAWSAVRRGPERSARCAAVLLPLLVLLYGVVLAFSLPGLEPARLRPQWDMKEALGCCGALLLPGAGLCLRREGTGRSPAPWCGAAAAAAAALVTGGVLGAREAAGPAAFLTLAGSLSLRGTMLRFEALISGAMLISAFCLACLLLAAIRSLLEALAGPRPGAKLFDAAGPILGALCFVRLPGLGEICGIAAICSGLIAWFLLPVASSQETSGVLKNF